MSTALLVITDGRSEYLARCVASVHERMARQVSERFMFDDTGDAAHRADLAARYPEFVHINAGPRAGFGGAIAAAWKYLAAHSAADWVFHLEQDFVFTRPVDLASMANVLDGRSHLVQMALRRQPWNDAERAAGGVIEQHPDAYAEWENDCGHRWLEHGLFYTTNPSLHRRSLCALGWPNVPRSEGEFTHFLLREGLPGVPAADVRFGFWGARDGGEWVTHIGDVRAGVGY